MHASGAAALYIGKSARGLLPGAIRLEHVMLEHLSIQQRFRLLLAVSLACFALCGLIVQRTLSEIRVNGPIYERIMQGQDLVADILPPPAYLLESYLIVLQLDAAGEGRAAPLLRRLRAAEQAYRGRHQYWLAAGLRGELEEKFLRRSHALAQSFYRTAFDELAPALQRGDQPIAARALARLGATYEEQRRVIEQVVELARQRNRADETAARERIEHMALSLVLMFAVIIGVFILIFNTVRRSIADPILDALKITQRVAAGDWHQQIAPGARGEAGRLLEAIRDIVKNTQTEIVKSEKMAALGSLVAGVSHELNTPVGNGLMAVSTLSEDLRAFRGRMRDGLKRSVLDEFLLSVETGADLAMRNLQRAADLMSSFKQVAADRASSQRRRFLLHQVVHETQMTLRPMLKRAKCEVVQEIPPTLRFDSFPGPLGQVIANLIENAAKHGLGEDGGVIVLTARAAGAGAVTISVKDRGRGIAPEMQQRVFEPFFTTRMGQGGSGLGLHIAHNIVYQILGGSIELRSAAGRGCCFDVTIPLTAPDDLAPAAA
jgi:signal transduction histidine kinase